ncbi:MAG: hypothetical protein ACI4F5_06450 [Acutalibacteraceae bacterium]
MPAKKPIAEIGEDGAVYVLQAGTPVYLKTADVSSIIGKSNQWVGQLTSQGTIHKKRTLHGSLYDMKETLSAYIGTLSDKFDKDETDEKVERTRKAAEAMIKKSKATIAKLDADEREGKMHRSEDVAAMTEDLIYAIRSALLALPGRLAVDVMQAADSAEASEIIREAIYEVMNELSNYEYDSSKYEERVRQRLNLEAVDTDYDDEEG